MLANYVLEKSWPHLANKRRSPLRALRSLPLVFACGVSRERCTVDNKTNPVDSAKKFQFRNQYLRLVQRAKGAKGAATLIVLITERKILSARDRIRPRNRARARETENYLRGDFSRSGQKISDLPDLFNAARNR